MLTIALWLASSSALAAPQDVLLSGMTDQDGERVLDSKVLGSAYEQLVKEVGTLASNKPIMPASTTGISGWEVSAHTQFIFNEAHDREGEPSPWARANAQEEPQGYQIVPTLSVRKGLPLSTEVGFNAGWVGATRTGVVGGYGRLALLEGYKPWPDLALRMGYSGYVGNDELDVGVMDMGATLGSTFYTGSMPGANDAAVSPYVDVALLRVSGTPHLSPDLASDIGAVRYGSDRLDADEDVPVEKPMMFPQMGVGFQVVAQGVLARIAVTWAPATIPTISSGMGFVF